MNTYSPPPLLLPPLHLPMPDKWRNGGTKGERMPVFNRPALLLPMPDLWREYRKNGGSIGKMRNEEKSCLRKLHKDRRLQF